MKKELIRIWNDYQKTPETIEGLEMYLDLRRHPGWKTHIGFLEMLQGMMLNTLVSDRFTNMDKEQKDILQRTYKNVNDIIGFLIDPYKFCENAIRIRNASKR